MDNSFKSEVIESQEVRKWVDNYLWVGEEAIDRGAFFLGASSWFERKR